MVLLEMPRRRVEGKLSAAPRDPSVAMGGRERRPQTRPEVGRTGQAAYQHSEERRFGLEQPNQTEKWKWVINSHR